ncbi:MAG: hypothetical protein EPN47_05325 [Acidobacteria bacterium]|nr:MAG: hypothetical protein EPN47_05325 [Acidobacteriota bacterium]
MRLHDFDPLSLPQASKSRMLLDTGDGGATGAKLDLWILRGGAGGKVVLALAGVHGDEYEGPFALWKLVDHLQPDQISGTLLILPVANWAAFEAGQRCTPVDSMNLNRVFPGNPTGSYTQMLAHDIFEFLVKRSDMVIDLHSGGNPHNCYPTSCYINDSPMGSVSLRACQAFGLPVMWSMPKTPGALTTEAALAGFLAIGAEFGGEGRLSSAGVNAYFKGVLRSLQFLGLLTGVPKEEGLARVVGGDYLVAGAEFGLYREFAKLGDQICAGQLLAVTTDLDGKIREEFRATCDGLLMAVRSQPVIRRGDLSVFPGWANEL